MHSTLKWLFGLFILAFLSTISVADSDWESCGGDGKTSSKTIEIPK